MDEDDVQEHEDSEVEIEVVDDAPEEDRGRPRRPEGQEPDLPNEEEIEQYSDRVQKRIKQLTREYHEERRAKEEAARIREEALRYAENSHKTAKQLHEENERLKRILADGENYVVDESKSKVESQIAMARQLHAKAYESGDSEGLLKAQELLAEAIAEKNRLKGYRPREYVPSEPPKDFQPPRQEARQEIPEPDVKAQAWVKRNPWFNRDSAMTGYVMGVHQKLIQEERIDPRSDEYYKRIDAEMRERFPDKFDDADDGHERQRRPVTVAPATRSGKGGRKVKLTQSEAAVAKRLGVSLEQYAAEKMRLNPNG